MSPILALPLAAGAVALAALALATRRLFASAAALAGMGICVAGLLLGSGFPGLAVAVLAAAWAVAAAGLVVGRRLAEVDAEVGADTPRGPWILGFVSSTLLGLAFVLGVLVVDWPPARAPAASGAAASRLAVPGAAALRAWALGALGIAAALALAAFAPRPGEE